jgi:hypothetical protein
LAYAAALTGLNRTPMMISSAARSTVNIAWKKSLALTARAPRVPLIRMSASSASIAAG